MTVKTGRDRLRKVHCKYCLWNQEVEVGPPFYKHEPPPSEILEENQWRMHMQETYEREKKQEELRQEQIDWVKNKRIVICQSCNTSVLSNGLCGCS
jgi:hypothetical protein